jgi:hypothetical protein
MQYSDQPRAAETAAPPRKRPTPPSEQVDEAQGQLEKQEVEIERELPSEHDQSIERIESEERPDPPIFDD